MAGQQAGTLDCGRAVDRRSSRPESSLEPQPQDVTAPQPRARAPNRLTTSHTRQGTSLLLLLLLVLVVVLVVRRVKRVLWVLEGVVFEALCAVHRELRLAPSLGKPLCEGRGERRARRSARGGGRAQVRSGAHIGLALPCLHLALPLLWHGHHDRSVRPQRPACTESRRAHDNEQAGRRQPLPLSLLRLAQSGSDFWSSRAQSGGGRRGRYPVTSPLQARLLLQPGLWTSAALLHEKPDAADTSRAASASRRRAMSV